MGALSTESFIKFNNLLLNYFKRTSDINCVCFLFYSIGSLGHFKGENEVRNIHVQDSTLVGSDNGLRIKAWPEKYPGAASFIFFSGITMNNVRNPIIIDEQYQCDPKHCKAEVNIITLPTAIQHI